MSTQDLLIKIFTESTWHTAKTISFLSSQPVDIVQEQLHKWEQENRIFSLMHNNVDFYPEYAFTTNFSLHPGIEHVLRVLRKGKTDIKIAAWFASVNSYLRNAKPANVIIHSPLLVIKAAEIELIPIDHG